MNKLRQAMGLFFYRPSQETTQTQVHDRTLREIRGSLYTLLALFLSVALTSYMPLDTFNLLNGRIDHINNMGGLVGAICSELFLGSLGMMGYSSIILAAWLSLLAFRGEKLKSHGLSLIGFVISSFLGALGCRLIWGNQTAEVSLLQGGIAGRYLGSALERLFNTTGALILVGGAFVITLIFTAHLSMLSFTRKIFGDSDEEKIKPEPERTSIDKVVVANIPTPTLEPTVPVKKTAPKAKRGRSKKQTMEGTQPEMPPQSAQVSEESIQEDSSQESAEAAPKVFTCREMLPFKGTYSLPSTRLLKSPSNNPRKMSKGELKENIQKLSEHLLSFQITGEITSVSQGPVLNTYEYKPSAGIKLSKIAALQEDLGVVLGTRELRIVAPIPGKTVVGIEVPRPESETIALKDCLNEKDFMDKKLRIPVALGRTTDGKAVFGDLVSMPHLLVAGATGSGKSVFINSLIMSFLFRMSPQQLRLILVDPKMLELNVFDGLPHLITNVITDNKIAFNALNWAVWEMDRRYALMAKTGSKNIDSFNEKQKSSGDKLPFIVVVVDELADLMMSGGEMVEIAITRLAQKARAAGIHLVIATQRPSTDVITGLIKANIPSRLSFKVPSGIDSRTVLDTSGAEELIGRGDSLMIMPGVPLRRLHGTFVTEEELKRTVKYCIDGKDHSENYIDFSGADPNAED
jgi:DNA segregation ATPase FtsK/SpoIIIE, S-DNA-T family